MNLNEYIIQNIDATFDGALPFDHSLKRIEKDSVITDFEQVEQNVYFLKKGIVQVEVRFKEEIRILDFFFKDSFFASYSSLLLDLPSDVRITAISNCELELISYEDLKKAYGFSLLANKIGRIETEKLYLRKVRREKELLTKTAEERYISLLKTNPDIIQEIPVKDISKYLGIQPESLSRIRKKIFS